MRRPIGLGRPWTALLSLLGCEPSASPPPLVARTEAAMVVSARRCEQWMDCGCEEPAYEDLQACVQDWTRRVDDIDFVAQMAGLDYDGSCVGSLLEEHAALACEMELDEGDPRLPTARCLRPCRAFVGPVQEGEPCEVYGATVKLDDCEQGLHCLQGRCEPLCPAPLEEGERCMAGIEVLGSCAPQLLCASDTGRCVQAPGLGDPCLQLQCTAGAFCDRSGGGDGICSPQREGGEPCVAADQCRSGRCEDNGCASTPAIVCGAPQTL